jgi:putative membrane protein
VAFVAVLTGCERDQNSDHFAKESAQGGMAEAQMGRLAAERGSNPAVKQFGQQMVDDHSKANNELTQLAARKNIQLPQEMTSEQKSTMDKLSKLSGAEFDREYVDAMVKDHEHDVEDFQIQANKGNDADVKAFAAKTLPVLQKRLQMIRDIKSKM